MTNASDVEVEKARIMRQEYHEREIARLNSEPIKMLAQAIFALADAIKLHATLSGGK